MWMLQQKMGRENVLAGLRAFIEEYKAGPDYPVIQDMLAVLRDFAPDTAAFDAFTEQWFCSAVLPEYRLSDVTKVREGEGWVVRGTVENVGTGRMRVEVGAGDAVGFEIRAAFEPERVVIDPDVMVLQKGRRGTVFEW